MKIGNLDIGTKDERDIIRWEIKGDYELQLRDEMVFNQTLKNVFSTDNDMTEVVLSSLWEKTHGDRPNHFVIIIRGLPGVTSTGIGKSSVAQIIASGFSDEFNHEMIGFTNDEILDIVKKFGIVTKPGKEVSQVYVRDETPDSLKKRADLEAGIMIESLRESKISLILVKPEGIDQGVAHYIFIPIAFSKDFKWVKIAVYNYEKDFYRGYIVLPIKEDNDLWIKYKERKKKYQQDVIDRKLGSFDHEAYAKEFLETGGYEKIKNMIFNTGKIELTRMKKYMQDKYPTLTIEERRFIIDDILEMHSEGKI